MSTRNNNKAGIILRLAGCSSSGRSILSVLGLALLFLIWPASHLTAEAARPRIISLYAAHTEVLLRLGAKDNIIGVSAQETYSGPETDGWKPAVFSIRDDVEKFLAAKPDLILVRPMHLAAGSRLIESLKSSGIKVHAEQVVKAGDLYKYWRSLAALVGREAEAEKMILDFDRQISRYYEAASRRAEEAKPGVFLEAIHGQIKTFTSDSLPVWLVELAGGRNVASDAKPQVKGLFVTDYGPERLLSKADEIDIFISQDGPMNNTPLEQVKKRDIYKPIRAFKDGRVYKISEDILCRPTPSLLRGLEELAVLTGLDVELAQVEQQPETGPDTLSDKSSGDKARAEEDLAVTLPPAGQ